MPSSLFTYLDDMATLMRHIAVTTSPDKVLAATKSATAKTTGVMSDDLAIKSKGVIGIHPDREIPIVGKIFGKCLKNLCWILPGVLAIGFAAPPLLPYITAAGGTFLTYEGAENLYHLWKSRKDKHHDEAQTTNSFGKSAQEIETSLIKKQAQIGIVNSLEMTMIAMATVSGEQGPVRMASVALNAVGMAGIVHGVVLGIVRMDDMGMSLAANTGNKIWDKAGRALGKSMLKALPFIMDRLPTLGLGAMFTVGGELAGKQIPPVEQIFRTVEHGIQAILPVIPVVTPAAEFAANAGITGAFGIALGFTVMGAEKIIAPPLKEAFDRARLRLLQKSKKDLTAEITPVISEKPDQPGPF